MKLILSITLKWTLLIFGTFLFIDSLIPKSKPTSIISVLLEGLVGLLVVVIGLKLKKGDVQKAPMKAGER